MSVTCYLPFQVDNEEIQQNMKEFQTLCLTQEPRLRQCVVPPQKAHITLLVLHLEDQRLEEAKIMFEEMCRDHFSKDDIFDVEFEGVGTFGSRVLFAKPRGNIDRIIKMSESFQSKYSCEYQLDPHLTLMKVKGKGLKKIPRTSYEGLEDYKFGIQSFKKIQFLSMTKPATKVNIL